MQSLIPSLLTRLVLCRFKTIRLHQFLLLDVSLTKFIFMLLIWPLWYFPVEILLLSAFLKSRSASHGKKDIDHFDTFKILLRFYWWRSIYCLKLFFVHFVSALLFLNTNDVNASFKKKNCVLSYFKLLRQVAGSKQIFKKNSFSTYDTGRLDGCFHLAIVSKAHDTNNNNHCAKSFSCYFICSLLFGLVRQYYNIDNKKYSQF